MNQYKNGTLLILVATFITAILILFSQRHEATVASKHPVADKHTKVTAEHGTKETHTVDTHNDSANNKDANVNTVKITATDTQVQTTGDTHSATNHATAHQTTENQAGTQTAVNAVAKLTHVKAPDGPFTQSDQVAVKPAQPAQQGLLNQSSQMVVKSTTHQPIWLDQKLGDFKSIEQGDVAVNLMPNGSNGLQGTNPKQVVTEKTGKFTPNKALADYNYQQMPMYNGGYYIAPMPPYLMPSVLPKSAVVETKQ